MPESNIKESVINMQKADIGMIGLAVMGENLSLNMLSKGFSVAVYNLETERVDAFVNGRAKGKAVIGTYSIKELAEHVEKPRKIMMMIRAGKPVDIVIDQLLPFLEAGDVIIDGGNTHYLDTMRRAKKVEERGIKYIGSGVSGGEEGALHGPSIMPGGSDGAWPLIKPIFQTIAARTENGEICCDWIGEDGSGHFVKMVHNGIEYGDMQLITEIYQIMKDVLGLDADQMSDVFKTWNKGDLESYLVEITGNILSFKDEDGLPLVDKILDKAGQKGTGKWTAITALEEGVPLTLIGEAVYARCLSAMKSERLIASKVYQKKITKPDLKLAVNDWINDLEKALYAAKIISYTQGYMLMKASAETHNWQLNYGGIALMWRGGCIIRSKFLGKIKEAFDKDPHLFNLLMDDFFKEAIESRIESLRKVVTKAIAQGIYVPALSAAINFFDGYTSGVLPHNLLQAQRDYFGAHTYNRVDKDGVFHTNWTGKGGSTSSTNYDI